jgi:hypothetical protein
VQSLLFIAQNAHRIVAADKRCMALGTRQTLEFLLEDELRLMRTNIVMPVDNSPCMVIEWWVHNGPRMPLLYVFAKVAIVTPISTVEIERQFSCNGKFCIRIYYNK